MPEERPAWAATAADAAEYRITGNILIQAFTLDLEIHGDADAFRLLLQVREFLRQPVRCRAAAREIDAWLEEQRDGLRLCPTCGLELAAMDAEGCRACPGCDSAAVAPAQT